MTKYYFEWLDESSETFLTLYDEDFTKKDVALLDYTDGESLLNVRRMIDKATSSLRSEVKEEIKEVIVNKKDNDLPLLIIENSTYRFSDLTMSEYKDRYQNEELSHNDDDDDFIFNLGDENKEDVIFESNEGKDDESVIEAEMPVNDGVYSEKEEEKQEERTPKKLKLSTKIIFLVMFFLFNAVIIFVFLNLSNGNQPSELAEVEEQEEVQDFQNSNEPMFEEVAPNNEEISDTVIDKLEIGLDGFLGQDTNQAPSIQEGSNNDKQLASVYIKDTINRINELQNELIKQTKKEMRALESNSLDGSIYEEKRKNLDSLKYEVQQLPSIYSNYGNVVVERGTRLLELSEIFSNSPDDSMVDAYVQNDNQLNEKQINELIDTLEQENVYYEVIEGGVVIK